MLVPLNRLYLRKTGYQLGARPFYLWPGTFGLTKATTHGLSLVIYFPLNQCTSAGSLWIDTSKDLNFMQSAIYEYIHVACSFFFFAISPRTPPPRKSRLCHLDTRIEWYKRNPWEYWIGWGSKFLSISIVVRERVLRSIVCLKRTSKG